VGVRLPRLEALLGVRSVPEDLDAGVLARLVETATPEDADLDFKRAPWPSGPAGAIALATDVAAFANTNGGLLLVGVEEEQTFATRLVPLPYDENAERGWRDVLAGRLAPPAAVVVRHVPVGEGGGVWAVAVPRSRDAPHAVRLYGLPRPEERKTEHSLLYPARDGTGTRWMTEAEVRGRYRDRFAAQRADEDRLLALLDRTASGLARWPGHADDGQWPSWPAAYVLVASVPTLPGDEPLDRFSADRAQAWLREWRQSAPAVTSGIGDGSFVVRRNRVVASGVLPGGRTRVDAAEHAALHTDGAGLTALFVSFPIRDWDRYPGATADDVFVGPLTVEQQLLAAVSLLAGHALRVRAGGDVLLAAQIVLPQAEGPTARGMVAIETEPFPRLLGGADRITGTTPAFTAVPVADLARGPGQVAAAAVLAGELLSDFGVAGTTGVHDDGTVTALSSLRGLAAWAGQHGVTARQ